MKEMLERIDYSNPENKHKMNELFCELMKYVEKHDEELYNKTKITIYEMINGKKITEDCAKSWVKNMEPVGQHWTIEETTSAMQKLGYNLDLIQFYVVANMMYNDQYDLTKEDETLALKLAYNWLNDVDAVNDKLYEYWRYIPKH